MQNALTVTILGSGTSHGIPMLACNCKVCTSTNPKDTRYRASCLVRYKDAQTQKDVNLVIDTGPEFRLQAIKYGITNIDAVLVTHPHADHIHGLDDVRPFTKECAVPIYSDKKTLKEIKTTFRYIFAHTQEGGGKPHIMLKQVDDYNAQNPLVIGGAKIVPIPMYHGNMRATGWRINNFAYLTDLSRLCKHAYPLLDGIDTLVIDGLRTRPHTTHFTFFEALDCAEKLSCKKIYLTHICHDFSHNEICTILDEEKSKRPKLASCKVVAPAYDGLVITIE